MKILRVSTGSLPSKKLVVGIENGKVTQAPFDRLKRYLGMTEEKFRRACSLNAWEIEEIT